MSFSSKINSCSDRFLFIVLFSTAFIFRLYAAFTSIANAHPDEIFQTVEMAHKLAFGKGFVFWEFKVGARSWFLPGIFAGIYKLLDSAGVKDPFYLNFGIKVFLAALHSLSVSVLFLLFRKWFKDRFTAFLFTLPLALSYILSYISVRTLSETTVLPVLILSIYQAVRYTENYKYRHLAFSVILAGIAFMIRFQTAAFSLGLCASFLFTSKKPIKTSFLFGTGYMVMIIFQGVLDKLTWGKFMHSFITYYTYNIIKGVANKHGVFPWHFYLKQISFNFHPVIYISATLFIILILFSLKKRKYELLFFMPFLFFLAVHSAISHKESRFIFPFYFAILAGSSALFALIYEKYFRNKFLTASLFVLLILSAYTSSFLKFQENWNHSTARSDYWGNDKGYDKKFTGNLDVSIALGRISNLKSAYVYGIPKKWSGGYAYFHKNAPITYSVKKSEIIKQLKKNRDSHKKGVFFAFKKGFSEPFSEFRDILQPVPGTDEFDIYKMVPPKRL